MTTPVRIKTFRADSLQAAYEQIRSEFGPGASVLETKPIKRGFFGKSLFEVTASTKVADRPAAKEEETLDSIPKPNEAAMLGTDRSIASPLGAEQSVAGPSDGDRGGAKDRMDTVSVSHFQGNASAKLDRICQQVSQEMFGAGLEVSIVEQWIMAARATCDPAVFQDAWSLRSEILTWVRDFVHCAPPLDLDSRSPLRIALIGPTGAGKTTTIAKLAATLSMERQGKVGILQLDPRNLGPCRSLAGYQELMGWEFEVVTKLDEIAGALERLQGCDRILLDTPGCSPSDRGSLEWLEQSLNLACPTSTLLVIPSTCNSHTFQRYELSFGGFGPDSMVLTKLDESGGLGSLFSCLQNSSIPVSFLTNGQHVPSDLIPATNARLAQHVFSFTS